MNLQILKRTLGFGIFLIVLLLAIYRFNGSDPDNDTAGLPTRSDGAFVLSTISSSNFALSSSQQEAKINNFDKYSWKDDEFADNKTIYIEDIFIGIKSTKSYHSHRLDLLLETWIPQANESVHLITDGEDEAYAPRFGKERYFNTGCGATHQRSHLVCKFQAAYNKFMSYKERYKWFCTVDDDTYVIIPNLVKVLRRYSPNNYWYIGKPSLARKYSVVERIENKEPKRVEFWFGTGGAGVCISKALAELMLPQCSGERFIRRGEDILNPDDTTLGYVCNYLLGIDLTVIPEFHSHIEPMWMLDPLQLHNQVTLSWGQVIASAVVPIPNNILIRNEFPQYPLKVDPTRMLTLHCYLFPESLECERIKERLGSPQYKPEL